MPKAGLLDASTGDTLGVLHDLIQWLTRLEPTVDGPDQIRARLSSGLLLGTSNLSFPDQPAVDAEDVDERDHDILRHESVLLGKIPDQHPSHGGEREGDESPPHQARPDPGRETSPAAIVVSDAIQRRTSMDASEPK